MTLALIALIGLWALGSSAFGLAETQVETSIATVVEADADHWLASLQQAPTERIELTALRAMIPANRTKPEPAMIRLFQEILKEARNLRLDARFHLLPRYAAESVAHVHRLERLQKYALRLGILGTFLGLILALGGFAPILAASGGTGASAPNSLLATGGHELVESLRLSFGTSIAGLAVSLFIAAQAELLRNRQAAYFRIMEDACHSLTALAGRTLQREDLLAGLEASTQALREVQAQLYDQSRKVENGLEALDARIGQQIAGVEQGAKQLDGMRQAWELQLTGMQQGVDDLLRGMRQISDHPSLDRLGEDLQKLEGELEQRLADELGRGFDRLVTEVDTLTTRVGRIDETLDHQTAELQNRMDGLVTTAGTIRDHVLAAAESSQRSLKEVPATLSRAPRTPRRCTPRRAHSARRGNAQDHPARLHRGPPAGDHPG